MTVPIVLSLVLLAVAGVVLYRRFGRPGLVALLSGAAALLATLWPRRVSVPAPPPPKAPDARVARTAGQIIEEREAKAREVIAAAESPDDVADIMGQQR